MKLAIFDPFEITVWQDNSPVLVDGVANAIAKFVDDGYAIAFACNQDCDELQCLASELDKSIIGCYIPSLDPACKPVKVEVFNKVTCGNFTNVVLETGCNQSQLFAPNEAVRYKRMALDIATDRINQCLRLVSKLPCLTTGSPDQMLHAMFCPDSKEQDLIAVYLRDPFGCYVAQFFRWHKECKSFRLPMTGMIHAWRIWAGIAEDEAENILVVSNQADLQSAAFFAGFFRMPLDEAIAEA